MTLLRSVDELVDRFLPWCWNLIIIGLEYQTAAVDSYYEARSNCRTFVQSSAGTSRRSGRRVLPFGLGFGLRSDLCE